MTELAEILKNERKEKNISLEEISEKTKISVKLLIALEKGEFEKIPGEFYLRGFIRNYLNAMNLNTEEFFQIHSDKFNSLFPGEDEERANQFPKVRYSRFKKKSAFLTFFSILSLVVLVLTFSYINKSSILQVYDFIFKKIDLPETGLVTMNLDKPLEIDHSPVNIKIDFLENCWTRIIQGNEAPVEKTFQKGQTFQIHGYEFSIYIGNPSSVRFLLNGRELKYLKNLSQPEKIDINPQNIKELLGK